MTELPLLADVRDAAVQGSYCPKLCTYACPVETATGDQHAVPWSFHRVVADLASGRVAPGQVAGRLDKCSGCLACQGACNYDQDVPAQVLAGRALAPVTTPAATAVLDHLRAGRRPDGSAPSSGHAGDGVVLFVGCQDAPGDVTAAVSLLGAAGLDPRVVVAPGCCGGVARDLGATELATGLGATTADALRDVESVVVLDPHCDLGDIGTRSIESVLAEHVDQLSFRSGATTVTVHDPCLTARRDGEVEPARVLLAAAGVVAMDPEGNRADTVCSGAGLSLPLVDAAAADATATRRADLLGGGPVVTWCGRAEVKLRDRGVDVTSLLHTLHERLAEA